MRRSPSNAPPAATALRLDWATHEAAKYACEKWHYSKCLPSGKILFSRGAAPNLLRPYGLTQYQGCELTRIALTAHCAPVSRILSIAIRFLKRQSPGLRLIVSFADPTQNHHGGIYQATNWVYTGRSTPCGSREYLIDGKWVHTKSMQAKVGTQSSVEIARRYPHMPMRKVALKHRYLMPLDDEMRRQIEPLRKPYPKRAGSSAVAAPANHAGEGGSIPTPALPTESP
jgi:hypothetical protein